MRVIDVSGSTSNSVMGVGSFTRYGFVVHTTSGVDSLRWLQGRSAESGTPASADYLIGRSGTTWKIIPPGHYGYHAGVSSRTSNSNEGLEINKHFFGIEIENNDNAGEIVTGMQYQACAEIIRREAQKHDMSPPKVYGHANIALPFGRRSDPVRFDYGLLFYFCSNPTPFMLAL